jgi:hypothetical protein
MTALPGKIVFTIGMIVVYLGGGLSWLGFGIVAASRWVSPRRAKCTRF